MANIDSRTGLRPINNGVAGTAPRVRPYLPAASVIYKNALLNLTAAGLVTMVTTGAASSYIVGTAAYHVAAGTAGAESREVLVYDDPAQEYVVQSDDGTLKSLADYMGRLYGLLSNASGNTVTKDSLGELDGNSGTSVQTVTAICLQCVGLYDQIGNAVVSGSATDSSNADFIVKVVPDMHIFSKGKTRTAAGV